MQRRVRQRRLLCRTAMTTSAPTTKPCIACGTAIAQNLTVCPTCKEYQSRWRNELKYWAAMAGLITLIGSGLVWTGGYVKAAYDYFLPPDPIVLELDTFQDLTIVNAARQSL